MGIGIDIEHLDVYAEPPSRRQHAGSCFIAEVTPLPGDESEDWRLHDAAIVDGRMRPVTAIVVLGLLLLIIGAFLWQLYLADAVL